MSDRAAGILTIITIVVFFFLAKIISQFINDNLKKK
jgi:hypothetical protein